MEGVKRIDVDYVVVICNEVVDFDLVIFCWIVVCGLFWILFFNMCLFFE